MSGIELTPAKVCEHGQLGRVCLMCEMRDELAAERAKVAELSSELERERMRLAGCSVAALGYFDGCADEYLSASLTDVLDLRGRWGAEKARAEAAEAQAARLRERAERATNCAINWKKVAQRITTLALEKKQRIADLEAENAALVAQLALRDVVEEHVIADRGAGL